MLAKKGDQKAMFEIYKLYYKPMYNASLRILKNTAEAEDIMQEAFLDAFQKIDQYDERSAFGYWLKRIVINKSLDQLKKKKDIVPIDELPIAQEEIIEEDHLEVLSYKVDQIKDAVNKLPDDYRIIVSLYLLEGYDHDEIAQVLEITNEKFTSQVFKSKEKSLLKP